MKRWLLSLALVYTVAANSSGFAQGTMNVLGYRPVAAEYSPAVDKLILISADPSRLHIYDAAGMTDAPVTLPMAPLALCLSPDGTHAAVGHDSLVSYVNLVTGVVERTFNIPSSAMSLAMSEGWLWVFHPQPETRIHSINLASGQLTTTFVFSGITPRYNPAMGSLYGTGNGSYGSEILRYNISTGPITGAPSINLPANLICGPVSFSPDGSRFYTGCGTVLHASTDPAQDLSYLTTLKTPWRSLAESASTKKIALIEGEGQYFFVKTDDSFVRLYESVHLNPVGQFALTDFPGPGTRTYKAHGRWVFFNAAATSLSVVVQADSTSGLLHDFAIETIPVKPSPSPCASLSSPAASVIADGETRSISITAAPSCTYEAVSDSPWLQIVAGGYGSGNGVLTFLARANGSTPRAGTISLNGASLTVNQSGAAAGGSLTRLSYNVAAATYNKVSGKLFIASAAPGELHVIDRANQTDAAIPLIKPALSLSLSPDGRFAAVGHDGWISYVNLQSMTVERVFQVSLEASSVLLAGNGYLYAASPGAAFYSLNTASGVWTSTRPGTSGPLVLNGAGTSMYSGALSRWNIQDGPAQLVRTATDVSSTCGNLWISEDGRRLFSACGKVYRTSDVPAQDMQLSTVMMSQFSWVDESAEGQLVATLPILSIDTNYQGSTEIYLYGDAFLDYQGALSLPVFDVGNSTYPGYGQFMFWNGDGSRLIVIEKSDVRAGLQSPYAIAEMVPDVSGQVPLTVPNSGIGYLKTSGRGNSIVTGSAIMRSAGTVYPDGLAIFGSRQGGVLVSEATVAASSPIPSGRIFAEVNDTVRTGLALANPGAAAAHVVFYFTDQNGVNFGSGTMVLPAHGQIAAFLDETPFNGGTVIHGTFTFRSDIAVAAIALRGHINERREFLWTTLPVIPLENYYPPTTFPSFADGGGWSTQFILVNPTDTLQTGTLKLNSAAITIGGRSDSSFPYSIPPRSSQTLQTSGAGAGITVGSANIIPLDGYPAGLVIFSERNASGVTISEAGVPAMSFAQTASMYAETSSDSARIQTGVAIATNSNVAVYFELTDLNGKSTGLKGQIAIPETGQVQLFLNQIPGFEKVPSPFRGLLRISSLNGGISVVGLRSRYNERGEFLITTTLPVTEYPAPPAELIFPHFADGGGFTTEFIFLNRDSRESNGALQFFSPSGQSLKPPLP